MAKKVLLTWKYIPFHLKGTARFFIDPGRFDIVNFFGINTSNEAVGLKAVSGGSFTHYFKQQSVFISAVLVVLIVFNFIKMLLVFWYFNPFTKKTRLRWLSPLFIFTVVLIGYIAFVTGPLGATRFAVPIVLVLNSIATQSAINLKQKGMA